MGFPYHVLVAKNRIAQAIPGLRVATDVPATRPARFVTLEAIPSGGGYGRVKNRVLSRRRLLAYAWGTDESDAFNLAEDLRSVFLGMPGKGLGVHAVDIVGEPARRDDVESGHRRFVMTVDLVMRANP